MSVSADEIERLLEKATKGPFCVESATGELTDIALAYEVPDEGSPIVIAHCWPSDKEDEDEGDLITYKQAKANAKLFVYLANHATDLAAIVRENERLAALREPVKEATTPQAVETDHAREAAENVASVRSSCGRLFLNVSGIAVAMQGDRCREGGFPESVLPPIPPEELEHATIGGRPAKDEPIEIIRWLRGDNWTEKMLEYAAEQINHRIQSTITIATADLRAENAKLKAELAKGARNG